MATKIELCREAVKQHQYISRKAVGLSGTVAPEGLEAIFEGDDETDMYLDVQSANAVLKVYDNISESKKQEFAKRCEDNLQAAAAFAWKVLGAAARKRAGV